MEAYRVTVYPSGKSASFESGHNLADSLREMGFEIEMACAGRGTCGKCKVKVDGAIEEADRTETAALTEEEIRNGIRLACRIDPKGAVSVWLEEKRGSMRVLERGVEAKTVVEPSAQRSRLTISDPTHLPFKSLEEAVLHQVQGVNCVPLSALRNLDLAKGTEYWVYRYEDEVVGLGAVRSPEKKPYGIAVDIGTTTVVAALVDLSNGEKVATRSGLNGQIEFGSDVISRITYVQENPKSGLDILQEKIVGTLNALFKELLAETSADQESVLDITVSGNTVMLHLLLGVNPVSIGTAPYLSTFLKGQRTRANSIGLATAETTQLYGMPSVHSYVGADIVAGIYSGRIHETKDTVLLVDIGTNGEMVLSKNGFLYSCACAAGPALEGMNISSGMRAEPGAVDHVEFFADRIELTVIGDDEPRGICGSGLLSLISELIRTGYLNRSGRLQRNSPNDSYRKLRETIVEVNGKLAVRVSEKVIITQKDIRNVQLAKAALLSGILCLLKEAEVSPEDVNRVLIAGQFGAFLRADSLVGCGILPKGLEQKIAYVGNTSLSGAYCALISKQARAQMEELAERVRYLDLNQIEGYNELFIDCFSFPTVTDHTETHK